MYIDTHTHLYDEQLMVEEDAMIARALQAGVSKMYMPNCDSTTIAGMLHLADKWVEHCLPMMGLHPCYVKESFEQELALVQEWLGKRKFAAVGEIGLDYYWDKTYVAEQKLAFNLQMDWALQHDLPIVIHSRESTQDCIDLVREKQNGKLKGIFHCFSGTIEEAKQIIDLGMYLGIGGVVTFKKTTLHDIVREVPLQHIVLETDAPYLAPVPCRGKRNESSYLPLVAQQIAALKNMDVTEVEQVTTDNAANIFPY
jgi:TatD DNase family protein